MAPRRTTAKSDEPKPDPTVEPTPDETPDAPADQAQDSPAPEGDAEPEVELLGGDESETEDDSEGEPEVQAPEAGSAPLEDPNPGAPQVGGLELASPQNPFGQDVLAEQLLDHEERRELVDARTGKAPDADAMFQLEHEHGRSYICRVRILENLYLPGHMEPISRLVLAAGMRVDADRAETLRALVRAQTESDSDSDSE